MAVLLIPGVHNWRGREKIWGDRRGEETNWIVVAETEPEAVGLVQVQRVRIKDADIHMPLLEAVGGDEANPRW